MEEDQSCIDSKTMMVEDMSIASLKLYKCYKVNDKLDGQVLFIFRLHTLEDTGQVDPLTERLIRYIRCTQQCMDSSWLNNLGRDDDDDEFLRSVIEITSRADIFLYRETDSQFAYHLTRLVRSCYRFSEGVLSAMNEDSLVFVVEVVRTCATNGLIIEATKRMLADSNRKESSVNDDENGSEKMIVESDDHVGYQVSNIGDEMDKDELSNVAANGVIDDANDCDYKSVVMDFCFDNDTEEEVVVIDEDEDKDEDEEMDYVTTFGKNARNDIINEVRNWQGLDNNYEPILEEIKPFITYEHLDWNTIGNDHVITKKEETRGECAICLTPYTGKVRNHPIFTWNPEANSFKLVRLGCRHSFHHRCIFRWLDKNQTCPLCRSVSYVAV